METGGGAVAIYRAPSIDSSHLAYTYISVIIMKYRKDDKWLIYRTHIKTNYTKCFANQDQIKQSLSEK